MLTLKDTVQRVAANTSPVLIWGETGTGKELFAQSLHSHSSRARGPFVAQNCAAIPTTLLESTLFGTTRGSYTGAENRKGLLKQADGGTLFLDEVNSMDLSLQAKILKAIEEKRFRPVGGEQDVHSDVRIVSAMNVDPITAVREGLLRRDLFYRLGVVQLALPPLRKRPEDIPLLTDFYVEQYNRNMGRAISGVSELVRNALLAYDWPGNVRELRNAVESRSTSVPGPRYSSMIFPAISFTTRRRRGRGRSRGLCRNIWGFRRRSAATRRVDCPCAGAEPDGYGGRGEAEADPAGTSIQDDEVPSQRIGL